MSGPFRSILVVSLFASAALADADKTRIRFHGQELFLNGLNLAWGVYPDGRPAFGDDIGPTESTPNLSHFQSVFEQLEASGANCMRLWLHTTGKYTPAWEGSTVTGPGQDAVADLRTLLDMAWEHEVSLMLCLWSFDMLRISNGSEYTDRAMGILTDPNCRQSYVDNALVPIVGGLKGHPAILAWEIFNEPEGMSNEHGWDMTRHVPMAAIQAFVNVCAGAIHRTDPEALVTNGSWAFIASADVDGHHNYYTDERLIAAGGDPDGTLDFYCVHYYDWAKEPLSPFLHPASHWKLDKPLVIAEFFPNCKFCTPTPHETLYRNGYAGALSWSWTDSDHQAMLDHIAALAKAHPQAVRIRKEDVKQKAGQEAP